MSDFHSDISLYCITDSPKVNPPWDNKVISAGKFENKIIDKMVNDRDILIYHNPDFTPSISDNILLMPPKAFYATASNYYHSILHELGHGFSADLRQARNLSKDIKKYTMMTDEEPDLVVLTNHVLTEGVGYFKQNKFDALLKNSDYTPEELRNTVINLILGYSREETKVEIVAMKMLQ
jgi:hypothetical protein